MRGVERWVKACPPIMKELLTSNDPDATWRSNREQSERLQMQGEEALRVIMKRGFYAVLPTTFVFETHEMQRGSENRENPPDDKLEYYKQE